MKTQHYILGISLLALGLNLPTEARRAAMHDSQQSLQNEINNLKAPGRRINRTEKSHLQRFRPGLYRFQKPSQ
ncbi:MAG: hypothetical protein ACLSE6_07525 [Alphaproteobacteria bacterium]